MPQVAAGHPHSPTPRVPSPCNIKCTAAESPHTLRPRRQQNTWKKCRSLPAVLASLFRQASSELSKQLCAGVTRQRK